MLSNLVNNKIKLHELKIKKINVEGKLNLEIAKSANELDSRLYALKEDSPLREEITKQVYSKYSDIMIKLRKEIEDIDYAIHKLEPKIDFYPRSDPLKHPGKTSRDLFYEEIPKI